MRQVETATMLKKLGIGALIGGAFSLIGLCYKLPASSIPLFIGTGVAASYLSQSKIVKSGNLQEDLNNAINNLPEDDDSRRDLQHINDVLYAKADSDEDDKMPVTTVFAQTNVIKPKEQITTT